MARNTLVINVDLRETRVALIENGVIAELQIERAKNQGSVGNVVLGKVTRVLPGMQAAFIDVGMERAAFLHVEDLIRPDDFEAYLAGGTGARAADEDAGGAVRGEGKRRADYAAGGAEGEGGADDDDEEDEEASDVRAADALAEEAAQAGDDSSAGEEASATEADDDEEDDSNDAPSDGAEDETEDDSDGDDGGDEESASEAQASDDDEVLVAAPGPTVQVAAGVRAEAPAEQAPRRDVALRQDAPRGKRRRRGRRGGGRDARDGSSGKNGQRREGGWRNDGRGGGPRRRDARISRSVPITEVVKEGDEVIVQISKEPIGTKGARVTSHVSLPGRHVVYLPTVEHVGVSKRIGSAKERARLRQAIDSIKPPKGGLIVRTVAEGLTKKQLKSDIGYLVKVWEEVSKRREGAKPPTVLYTELDLVLKVARDLFTDEIEHIVIDDREQYGRLVRFVEMFMPERAGDIELYQGDEPIFDAYGIEDEIARALSRKVPLPSGGYLIIDQAEALTAIDVNTGRFVGKGSRDLEETALKTNLEAVDEIAYQLRFRNIGGLVILDLIDMERPGNREQVWRALEAKLAKDKAKTTLNRISELGLIEMTRKRTRESLGRVMHEPCFYCDGTGQIQSRATIAYEILRQIRRDRAQLAGYSVVVNAHPAVIDFMQNEEKEAVEEAARRFQRRITLTPRPEYHIEQFDLQGK
jgi:ribonuclease G